MKFKIILKNLREDNDLKQKDIADFLGVSRTVISHYESGRNEPDINTLIKLSNLFNVSIDFLITGNKFKTRKLKH